MTLMQYVYYKNMEAGPYLLPAQKVVLANSARSRKIQSQKNMP